MIEITPDNAADYLRAQGWVGTGPIQVAPLGWGVSNAVFRVETPERIFVVKQSRPQLRTRDAWFSDLDRVYREQEVMEVLHPLLPPHTVPGVLFVDRANYAFAMEHAPIGAQVWKEQLLAGEIDTDVGRLAGVVLGRMHEATGKNPRLIERFRDHTVFVQLRVDPFYRRIRERRPEVAAAVGSLIEKTLTMKEAICHGDYSPKNILTHAYGFTLVDYETACLGDPTFDIGFFLSHLVLKAVRSPAESERFFALTRGFWQGYESEVTYRPAAELAARGIQHFAACSLARIDGTSPVDYLPEEPKREAVRHFARAVFGERPPTWEQVLILVRRELHKLAEGP